MDCSSPYAMAGLSEMKDSYDIAFGNDSDFDRHGVVTPVGVDEPQSLPGGCGVVPFQNRPAWAAKSKWGGSCDQRND